MSSTSLLKRVRRKEQDAWARFVTLYCPLVYDVCRKYRVQPSDADDIVQEVLRSVYRAIAEMREDRAGDSLSGWLYRISQNKILDHFRRKAKEPPGVGGSDFKIALEQIEDDLSTTSASTTSGINHTLKSALEVIRSEFQERTWKAFWRLTVEGHGAAEIAADLGMTANNVRQAKFRVIQRLREEFGDLVQLPE